jgi:hypothetical protein
VVTQSGPRTASWPMRSDGRKKLEMCAAAPVALIRPSATTANHAVAGVVLVVRPSSLFTPADLQPGPGPGWTRTMVAIGDGRTMRSCETGG